MGTDSSFNYAEAPHSTFNLLPRPILGLPGATTLKGRGIYPAVLGGRKSDPFHICIRGAASRMPHHSAVCGVADKLNCVQRILAQ
jgi:hypothetical protein